MGKHSNKEPKVGQPEIDLQSIFSQQIPPIAIYRLIGNDMPPLQRIGQLRWNTQFALDYELNFAGARKRWILNRIWNSTEFTAIYSSLLAGGVHRRDILLRCFDLDTYAGQANDQDKLLYLTSQNEGRNAGIIDGRESGFEWSMILDGNTFITNDSWAQLARVFTNATLKGHRYIKIPYHRLHVEQSPASLNTATTMQEALINAPIKGESQIAFHKLAPELFTLGDTKPTEEDKSKRKGYGQRNKSYMFKESQICGHGSEICMCSDVPEGNEEQFFSTGPDHIYRMRSSDYITTCGLVLRLWNFPPENVIFTGMTERNETGFFCYYLESARASLIAEVFHGRHYYSECNVFNAAVERWAALGPNEREPYIPRNKVCKDEYHLTFLNSSCFRAEDRTIAQSFAATGLKLLMAEHAVKVAEHIKESPSTCSLLLNARKNKHDPNRDHYLLTLSDPTLAAEREAYRKVATHINGVYLPVHLPPQTQPSGLAEYISSLVDMADCSLTAGALYSVVRKKKNPPSTLDKHHYYSVSPHMWPVEEVPDTLKKRLEDELLNGAHGKVAMDEKAKRLWKRGYFLDTAHSLPGSSIGEAKSDNYDQSAAWYMIDNVTTMALAWFFTNDTRYSEYGTRLVRTWFLNNQTSMYPKLMHASSLLEWKQMHYFLDSVSLLERSGVMPSYVPHLLENWCRRLADWLTTSQEGREEVSSRNHHGLYFDLTVLSLSAYAFEEDMLDGARSRLAYRLTQPYPNGHFAANGSQPYETEWSNVPAALHYASLNLIGWIHAALVVDSVSNNAIVSGVMPSLWELRHVPHSKTVTDSLGLSPTTEELMDHLHAAPNVRSDEANENLPVLLKAIRYLAQFLPDEKNGFDAYTTTTYPSGNSAEKGLLGMRFPFKQEEPFNFDRILEIVQIGVKIYGANNVFPNPSASVEYALKFGVYSTTRASFGKFSSISNPAMSGQRSWGALGRPVSVFEGSARRSRKRGKRRRL